MSQFITGQCSKNEKKFVVINTTSYNNDGNYGVTICTADELKELGFDDNEIKGIKDLMVGFRWFNSVYGVNVQVIRLG